jgi:type II secretory pathway component PulF
MPLIITPHQLTRRAELYHQMAIMITAGLSVHKALEQLKHSPPSRALRQPISEWLDHLEQGHTVSQSLELMGKWIPSFDIALIDAGERSGRLDVCFRLLAKYYEERAQMARQMISDLLYPAFVFNFSIVLFPLVELFKTGNLLRFSLTVAFTLGPIYLGVFFIILACQGRHGEKWRSTIERIARPVPVLGTARRCLALARLSAALEGLLNAGVSILSAWDLAATASGSPSITRVVQSWKPALQEGSTPSEMVSNSSQFPELFANLYHTGEVSGQLDETLGRLHNLYQEEGSRKMRALSKWIPMFVYLGVVCYVAWKIISFYTGYFQQVNDAIDMK